MARAKRKSSIAAGGGETAQDARDQAVNIYLAKWNQLTLAPANFLAKFPTREVRIGFIEEFPGTFTTLFGFDSESGEPIGKYGVGHLFRRPRFTAYLSKHKVEIASFLEFIPTDLGAYCNVVPGGAVLSISDLDRYRAALERGRGRWWVSNRFALTPSERVFVGEQLPELVTAAKRCPVEKEEVHRD
jgi:hypothetical protein